MKKSNKEKLLNFIIQIRTLDYNWYHDHIDQAAYDEQCEKSLDGLFDCVDQLLKMEQEKTIKWMSNYWSTLKNLGSTDKQLIIKMNKYFDSLANKTIKKIDYEG